MSEDDAPKSAYELAMERLRKQDADAGIEIMPLTEPQRAAIAEIRNFYESKAAEREVLHQSEMRRVAEPDARALLEEQYPARPGTPQLRARQQDRESPARRGLIGRAAAMRCRHEWRLC